MSSRGKIAFSSQHDRWTKHGHFRDRIDAGKSSSGVFIVSKFEPIGPVVEVLMMVWAASDTEEWHNQIRYLPSLPPHLFGR